MAELSELFPDCEEPTKYRVALLNVSYCTKYLGVVQSSGRRLEPIREDSRRIYLTIDINFHDLTPMNEPETPIVADVVAITGLGGHAFGSWRSRAITTRSIDRPMWLRDFLPDSFPNIRIMCYGYNSSLSNFGGNNFLDYRRNFKQCLENARQDCQTRPIIFIGHSLGGILCIQTLIESSQFPEYRHLYECIRGLFLFGTPHDGLVVDDLHEMVDDENKEAKYLLTQLEEGSMYLQAQRDTLSNIWGGFRGKVITFYETERTNQVTRQQETFSRGGKAVQMVQRMSAQLHLPGEHRHSIHSNHTNMVKFDSPQDRAFKTVVRYLRELSGHKNRKSILEMCAPVVRDVVESYVIDQKKYLETLPWVSNLESDGKYFWIFQNLDYIFWLEHQRNHESYNDYSRGVSTLVLSGSHVVEQAASHIVRNSPNTGPCLCFFYGSRREGHHPPRLSAWKDLTVVCTLLKQLVEYKNYSSYEQPLLNTFLEEVLVPDSEKELQEASRDLKDSLKRILEKSSEEVLWSAFKRALKYAMELSRGTGSSYPSQSENTQHATFVFDLDYYFGHDGKTLIRTVQRIIEDLQRVYPIAGLMVTCKPEIGDFSLKRPLEALIEYDRERQACLRTLRLYNARYQSVAIHHAHTFEWLQKSREYRDWSSSKESGILLVEGKPGGGKSTLVRYFNEHLLRPNDGDIVAKFFYSARSGELERDHCNMFKSLLCDILGADGSFFIHFQQAYRKLQSTDAPADWPQKALEDTLRACIERHPLKRRIFLIIDALDESDPQGRTAMVELLCDLLHASRASNRCVVKIFLASRPIEESHLHLTPGCTRILLQEHTKDDIEKYARSLVEKALPSDKAFEEQVLAYIIGNAAGVFLWVQLVTNELRYLIYKGVKTHKIFSRLKLLPTKLDQFYIRMLKTIQGDGDKIEDIPDFRDEDDISDGIRILQFCLFSHRAIGLIEMDHALEILALLDESKVDITGWELKKPGDIKRRLIYCTGNFLETKRISTWRAEAKDPTVTIQVMHQTVREFFLKPHPEVKKSKFADIADVQKAQRMIQVTCIRYMEIHYREVQKFANFDSTWSRSNMLEFVQYLDTRPFIRYSLEYLLALTGEVDQGIVELFSEMKICIDNSPASYSYSLLKPLGSLSTDSSSITTKLNNLLAVAAEEGYVTATGNLLAAGANAEAMENGRKPLHLAARNGHELTARTLLADGKTNVEEKEKDGRTALHLAVWNNHELTARMFLVDWKASVEEKDKDGRTALHLSAQCGHEATARMLLVDGKASIEEKDNNGRTALHLSAQCGHEATARMLLVDRKASIEEKDEDGRTALHLSAQDGHEAMARMLLVEGKANVEKKDNNGRTALHLAARNGHKLMVRMLLIDGEANVEANDNDGRTALHLSARHGHEATVRTLLVDGKCNVEAKYYNLTALHLSAWNGHEAVARTLLVDGNASVEAKHNDHTALHLAAWNGHGAVARTLLFDGHATIEAKDNDGRTALHLAAWNGHEAMARMLLIDGKMYGIEDNHLWEASPVEEILEKRYPLTNVGSKIYKAVYVLALYWDDSYQEEFAEESRILTTYLGETLKYATQLVAIESGTLAHEFVEALIEKLVGRYGKTSENLFIIHYGGRAVRDKPGESLFWKPCHEDRKISEDSSVNWSKIQQQYLTDPNVKYKADVLLLLDCSSAGLASTCDSRIRRGQRIELLGACVNGLNTPLPRYGSTFTKVLVNTLKKTLLRSAIDIRTLHSLLCASKSGLLQTPFLFDYTYARIPGSMPSIRLHRLETRCIWQEEDPSRPEVENTAPCGGRNRGILENWYNAINKVPKSYKAVYVLAFYWTGENAAKPSSTMLMTYMRQRLQYATRMAAIEGKNSHDIVETLIKWLVENYGNTSDNLIIIHYSGPAIDEEDDELRWASSSYRDRKWNEEKEGFVNWSKIQRQYLTGPGANCKADVLLLLDCDHASLAFRCDHSVWNDQRIELMAACAMGLKTPLPSYEYTFTKVFLNTLKKGILQRSAIDTRTLHSLLCRGKNKLIQTPVFVGFGDSSLPSIRLHPLEEVCSWRQTELNLVPH